MTPLVASKIFQKRSEGAALGIVPQAARGLRAQRRGVVSQAAIGLQGGRGAGGVRGRAGGLKGEQSYLVREIP